MKVGIVVFPASNCDHDAYHAFKNVLGVPTRYLWHKDSDPGDIDLVVLPGGFSYGDYLRSGALARFSPVMREVAAFARRGGRVLGICNGFQILTEAGLLPGALLRNRGLRFICDTLTLRVESAATAFTSAYRPGEVVRMPVAHGDGSYFADAETLARLEGEGRVVLRYCDADGELTEAANPNGSRAAIAGIVNASGNVMGLMPHPERVCEQFAAGGGGGSDGRRLLEAAAGLLAA